MFLQCSLFKTTCVQYVNVVIRGGRYSVLPMYLYLILSIYIYFYIQFYNVRFLKNDLRTF